MAGAGRKGRPRATRRGALTLGVDLGGTKILAGVVDAAGKVLGRGKVKTPFSAGADALAGALVEAADAALAEAGRPRRDVGAIGVAAPGPIDAAEGVLLRANNLAVTGFSVPGAFAAAFPRVPVALENDVRLAALAEARLGAGRGARCLVAVWVGTGVGGAVVLDGEIWTGRNRNAGEIGQMVVDLRRARPGETGGTLESIAAKTGMTRYLRRRLDAGEKTLLERTVRRKDARLGGRELAAALARRDRLAARAVERSARAVGVTMASVFDLLSPDLFVLGGGVAQDVGAPYLASVRKWAEAFAFTTELGSIRIEPAALGDDAGLLGAALHARERAPGAVRR